jgi:2-hydroxychromene-2-carboxylate isomerase
LNYSRGASPPLSGLSGLRAEGRRVGSYAYIGWSRIHDVAAQHQREVEPVPILFAALLDHWGQKAPAEIPAKRRYVFTDALRTCRSMGPGLTPTF